MKRIVINTTGGDAPGLNAVIRAVVLTALNRGWEVFGALRGYEGLVEDAPDLLLQFDRALVRRIGNQGGTILGTCVHGDPFNYPVESGGETKFTDVSEKILQRFAQRGFDALVTLGGDRSMAVASRLIERGFPRVIGVPKTIDNDLRGTNVAFGFATAVETATEALDRLHPTAEAQREVMVLEVMGRQAGWIALHAGISGAAHVILVPEIPFSFDSVCEKIEERFGDRLNYCIIVVSEGATEIGGHQGPRIAERIAREIEGRTPYHARALALGHLQRGGAPVSFERLLAQRLGSAAVRYLADTDRSGLVSQRDGEISLVPFAELSGGARRIDVDSDTVVAAREAGTCFGDEPKGTFIARAISRR